MDKDALNGCELHTRKTIHYIISNTIQEQMYNTTIHQKTVYMILQWNNWSLV